MAMAIQDKMAARARARWLAAKAGSDARETSALLLFDTIAAVGFAAGIAGAIAAGSMQAWPYMVLAAGSGAARGLFARAAARKGAADAARAKIRLRCDVVAAALRRPAAATLTTGALMSAAIDEVEALDGFVARFAPARKAAAIAPVLVLVAIAFASPLSAAILIATLVPFILAMALAGGAAADQSRRQFTALARLTGHFADRVRALPVVLAYRAEARETVVLAAAADELAERATPESTGEQCDPGGEGQQHHDAPQQGGAELHQRLQRRAWGSAHDHRTDDRVFDDDRHCDEGPDVCVPAGPLQVGALVGPGALARSLDAAHCAVQRGEDLGCVAQRRISREAGAGAVDILFDVRRHRHSGREPRA